MSVKKNSAYNLLRTIALAILLTGAVISLILMFRAGHKNNSVLLIALFAGWVLSPFAGLLIANKISSRWNLRTRVTLYCLMLFVTLISIIVYSGALSPAGTKPAFVFLFVPLLSWFLIITVIPIAVLLSKKMFRKDQE